jgi:glycosyltransferase involved in cell wall biosynthesis
MQANAGMSNPAIHQFHSGSALGDGVTNGMLFTQKLLRELGFASNIYVQHVDPALGGAVLPHTALRSGPDDVLLVHHSMGHDLTQWVIDRPERKIIVYHNITPPAAMPTDSPHRQYAEIGRLQLKLFRQCMIGCIAVSPFNAQELTENGYKNIGIIPLLVDLDNIRSAPFRLPDTHPQGRRTPSAPYTILSVGRVSEHKCQHQIIDMARHLRRLLLHPFQVMLLGGYEENSPYIGKLRRMIADHDLGGIIHLPGKVSDTDLYGWYRATDVLLSLSDHEGFCMPLVEAMAVDLPVVAYGSGNVPSTLDGAGLLLERKWPDETAALIAHLLRDRALQRKLIARGRTRLASLEPLTIRAQLARYLSSVGIECSAPTVIDTRLKARATWQVEGPCETSYSLAIVNRELAGALNRAAPGTVGILPMEGTGDYTVDQAAVDRIPGLPALVDRGSPQAKPKVALRNCYPPRVHDMDGVVNLLQLAWEESRIPPEWVASFNTSLDAVAVPTRFVRKVLIDAGVTLPIRVSGHGIDHILTVEPESWPVELGKGFRFLHVSSCFPRKGPDVLLTAYGRAFRASDDVTLVIKTFPNPHNTIDAQVADLRAALGADCPDIVVLNQELPLSRMLHLYKECDVLVGPSRGEGFGLPFAEAMAMGLPVIVTGHGAQLDFCDPDTSWLIDYRFAPTRSHHAQPYSVWAEPDPDDLARLMREAHALPAEERRRRGDEARARVHKTLLWDQSATELRDLVRELDVVSISDTRLKLGWVSTFNSRCGIATYSDFLTEAIASDRIDITILANHEPPVGPDPDYIVRCWHNRDQPELDGLLAEVDKRGLEVVVIQFNYAFYDLDHLGRLIDALKARRVVVVIMFHATGDVLENGVVRHSLRFIASALARCDRLLVHSVNDLNRMKEMGFVENTMIFPHGAIFRADTPIATVRQRLELDRYDTIIGMYGFLLPNKGVVETIEAMPTILAQRPNSLLLLVNALYPNPVSNETMDGCAARIAALGLERNVVMITDYLEHEESLSLLEATDLLVFPYQHSNESASGAVKVGLAANRPVLCSPLSIFSDLDGVTDALPGIDSASIARGVLDLLNDPDRAAGLVRRQRQWLEQHDWAQLGDWLGNTLRSLRINAEPVTRASAASRTEASVV